MIVAGRDQIQGWKEIAAYLARDERTVKRWEKQRGLPVRRIPGSGRANVYILLSELDAWLRADPDLDPVLTSSQSSPNSPPPLGHHASESVLAHLDRCNPQHPLAPQHPHHPPDPLDPLDSMDSMDRRPTAQLAPAPASLAHFAPSGNPPDRINGLSAAFSEALFPLLKRPRLSFTFTLAIPVIVLLSALAAGSLDPRPTDDTKLRAASATHPPRPARTATAVELYLQGVYLYEERTPASLEQARRSFEKAIAQDSSYAEAYAGLSAAYLLLREYATMPSEEAYRQARVAATRAVALNPNLPEAHACLGFIDFFDAWDAPAGEREFQQALRLDPNSAIAHHWYGSMLTHQARFSEALEQLNAAQRLQPTSPAILASKAYALGLGGHRDEAAAMLGALIGAADGATAAPPHRILALLSLSSPTDIPRYLSEMRRFAAIRNQPEQIAYLAHLASAYNRAGERGMWSELLSSERALHPSSQHPTFRLAEAEASLGLRDAALRDLTALAHQHDLMMVGIAIDPAFRQLRSDPRFQQTESEIGIYNRPSRATTDQSRRRTSPALNRCPPLTTA